MIQPMHKRFVDFAVQAGLGNRETRANGEVHIAWQASPIALNKFAEAIYTQALWDVKEEVPLTMDGVDALSNLMHSTLGSR